VYSGSSPRAWGGCREGHEYGRLERFIPTGVGRFRSRTLTVLSGSVHPHGRGAVDVNDFIRNRSDGSSPRAWGGYLPVKLVLLGGRFIPTGVGRFSAGSARATFISVHPHGRGAVEEI